MKFIVEQTDNLRVLLLHFTVPVVKILPRLVEFSEKDDLHPNNPGVMVTYKIANPKEILEGAEIIRPISRYSLLLVVGKAFRIQDTVQRVANCLEIIIDETEWAAWMAELDLDEELLRRVKLAIDAEKKNPQPPAPDNSTPTKPMAAKQRCQKVKKN